MRRALAGCAQAIAWAFFYGVLFTAGSTAFLMVLWRSATDSQEWNEMVHNAADLGYVKMVHLLIPTVVTMLVFWFITAMCAGLRHSFRRHAFSVTMSLACVVSAVISFAVGDTGLVTFSVGVCTVFLAYVSHHAIRFVENLRQTIRSAE